MPRERKGSSSDDSGGSSSGESSGSDSSATQHSKQGAKRTPKKDTSASKMKGGDSTPAKSRRGEDDDSKDRHKKGKTGSGELSSSDGEHIPRSGPRSTVVQKVSTESRDKGKKRDEGDKGSPEVDTGKDKREDTGGSRSKKRSRSESPRNRDSGKRWKEDRSSGRSSDRRDRRQHRDDRDTTRGRSWRDGDRRRTDSRRRDEDRRGDGRRDSDRDRYDRKRERDNDRKSDHKNEKRRDRDDREKDRVSRREENKENKKNENVAEAQKRKSGETEGEKEKVDTAPPEKKTKDIGDITTRTGGAYIPPAKLRMMQAQITDKSSVEYQRMAWEALKKSINGLVNKVNVSNIVDIVREVFQENIVRGRGLLARSVIQAQAASPTFTHVYAALVAIINTKFPQIGELILGRLILQFKRGFRRNDKNLCLSSTRFIAHLVNQQVAHEVISLEILTLLLENTTENSVEMAINFLKECGQKLTEVSPRGINAIFERLRTVLNEAQLDRRVQYMIEVMFAVRKDAFKAHPAIISDLDLVEEDDQFTHLLQLDDVTAGQEQLNVFKADDDYLENEEKYKELKKEILDEGSSDEGGSGDESGSDDDSDDDDDEEEGKQEIIDQTETNMVALRRTIYLTIQSSLDYEECAHKLLKMELKPGQEVELCYMILDCCAQLRTYEKFYGLLAQRFCQLDKKYVEPFQTIFREQFETIHRLDTNKLRNVAKFFAHLLHTDAISWGVMSCMKLTEEDTTSASRIFIKILFLELSEYMGLPKLNNRLRDPTLQEFFEGILPRNNPKDTRFAINFFTTIGLGGLTEDLREHLKGISKQLMQHKQQQEQQQKAPSSSSDSSDSDSSDSDSSGSSDSGSSDSSDSDSEDSDSSSDSEEEKKRKKKKTSKRREASKDKATRFQGRRLEQRNSRHDPGQADGDRGHHSKRDDGRSRIEDKLLKLSLPKGMSLVDPSAVEPKGSPPGRKNREKSKKKKGRGNVRAGERREQQRQHNSGRKRQVSNSIDQGGDRDSVFFRGEREGRALQREDIGRARDDMVRSRDRMVMEREDMGRGRPMTPPPVRRQDGYPSVDGRGGRRDLSPVRGMARWDSASDRADGYFQPRGDRMDLDISPPRGGERRGHLSPDMRRDRQDFDDFPPPRRHDRELDDGAQRPYDRQDLDVDGRFDSLPRGQRRRDGLTPPPRMGRRDMESPPRHMDSPPRHSGRMDIDRGREDYPRGRGDIDRNMDRGRVDIDRSRVDADRGRGEVDRSLDRGRRDMERERTMDRARGDMDRNLEHRDLDRGMDRGRDDIERGRGNVRRSLERGRGDLDWDRDFEPGMERNRNMDRNRMDMDRNGDRGRIDMDRGMEVGRGNVSRSVERGRGDVERGRVDLDRGMDRRDVDREMDRSRGRMDHERSRDDVDKGRMVERDRDMNRGRDRSRGRVEPESPVRQSRKEMTRSPPLPKRRDMNHSTDPIEGDRRQGRDHMHESDDRGNERSLSPPARKEKTRERNDDSVSMRRSASRDKKERRKTSQKNKDEGRRDRTKEKRHR